jgi:hypothetical protein
MPQSHRLEVTDTILRKVEARLAECIRDLEKYSKKHGGER